MKEKLMFESYGVTFVRNGQPTFNDLFKAVAARLAPALARIGLPYDNGTLIFNIQCVCEDAKAGRIPDPGDTLDGWVDAIAAEFEANLQSAARRMKFKMV